MFASIWVPCGGMRFAHVSEILFVAHLRVVDGMIQHRASCTAESIASFLIILQQALASLNVAGIVLCHEHTELQAAIAQQDNAWLLCWTDARHLTLFTKVHAILHHGGAGTAHTALQLGLPQGNRLYHRLR